MRGVYRIAEKNIEIISVYPYIHRQCADYRDDGKCDFSVETTRQDIDFEREKIDRDAMQEGQGIVQYSDAFIESIMVYRKIAEVMPAYDTFLFHGSAIAVDGLAYLFTAKSGTGKSTHTYLWREMLGTRAIMVNDDKPLIRITGDKATIYGTPWQGKENIGNNISVPLKAVCLLERAERNHIRAITKGEAYAMLLQQAYRPMNGEAMRKTLRLLDGLCERVQLYKLGCNMDIEVAEIAYNAMKG